MDWNLEEATDEHILLSQEVEGGYRDHLIPWAAIASWGELLGIPEPELVLEAILREAHDAETEGIDWSELYAARRKELATRQEAEAPTQLLSAPSPVLTEMVAVQASARSLLGADAPRVATRAESLSPIRAAIVEHQDTIAAHAEDFRAQLRPAAPTESSDL